VTRLALLLVFAAIGCIHADVKGREHLRLGPVRELRLVPIDVDPNVRVDAGTDVFTDAELDEVERALALSLQASFQRLAADGVPVVRAGRARVDGCRIRAGPGARFIVYVARCRVSVIVSDVVVLDAAGEGLRRTAALWRRLSVAKRPAGQERDPLVDVADSRAVLEDALDAAARVLVDGPLPSDERPPMPRAQRAALARARLAAASTAREKIAALFDLRSSGGPADAMLALPILEVAAPLLDAAPVVAAAVDAIGELCDPALRPRIEAVPAALGDVVIHAQTLALVRLAACAAPLR
jgi:hypothetical protein